MIKLLKTHKVKVKISSSVADNILHTKPGHLRYDGLMLQRRKTDQQKNISVRYFLTTSTPFLFCIYFYIFYLCINNSLLEKRVKNIYQFQTRFQIYFSLNSKFHNIEYYELLKCIQ